MNKLFEDNTRLVYKVFHDRIKNNPNYCDNLKEDLIQIGMLALWKCCMRYEENKGASFCTYAYSSIYKNMMCFLVRETTKTKNLISLSKPVMEQEDECNITFEDILASKVDIAGQVEIEDIVERIVAEMQEEARKIVNMFREGHSKIDISRKLDISRSTVHTVIKKFTKMLKDTLFYDNSEYNKQEKRYGTQKHCKNEWQNH